MLFDIINIPTKNNMRTIMTTDMTPSLNKKFIKDMGLPIPVLDEPLFSHFIQLYENQFNSIEKYNTFKDLIDRVGEKDFSSISQTIIDTVIHHLSGTDVFSRFNDFNLSKEQLDGLASVKSQAKRKDIYKRDNVDQKYISIDMVSANFQSLYQFDNDMFEGHDNYVDFLSKFTDEKYFLASKKIRQVIFGNLSPKKTMKYSSYLMSLMCQELFDLGVNKDDLFVFSNDEIFFLDSDEKYSALFSDYVSKSKYKLHIEFFELKQVHEDYSFYSKDFKDGSFTLKCVPAKNYAEVFRFRSGQPAHEKDLYYSDEEDRLSLFDKNLF